MEKESTLNPCDTRGNDLIDSALMTTKMLEEMGVGTEEDGILPVFQKTPSPSFDEYLTDADTDIENSHT